MLQLPTVLQALRRYSAVLISFLIAFVAASLVALALDQMLGLGSCAGAACNGLLIFSTIISALGLVAWLMLAYVGLRAAEHRGWIIRRAVSLTTSLLIILLLGAAPGIAAATFSRDPLLLQLMLLVVGSSLATPALTRRGSGQRASAADESATSDKGAAPDEAAAPDEGPTPDETRASDESLTSDEVRASDEGPTPDEGPKPDESATS